jgi:hypothetical protein
MTRTKKYLLIGAGAFFANLGVQIAFQTYIKLKEAKTWSVAGVNQGSMPTLKMAGWRGASGSSMEDGTPEIPEIPYPCNCVYCLQKET